jgi:phosphatidylglycerol:prolipoprotein diacylglycerol transferase
LIARKRGSEPGSAIDASLVGLIFGILGGRLAYVAIYWEYFSSHLTEALSPWRGGLSFQGALVGGILGVLVYALWRERSFWPLADALTPGLALGQGIGWIGCLLTGCAYGLPAKGWLAWELPDIYGIVAFRLPVQAIMSGLNGLLLVLLLVLIWRRVSLFPGFLALLYLLLSSISGFGLEFMRGDETLYIGLLRWSQVVEIGEFLLAIGLLIALGRIKALRGQGII